MLAIDCVPRQTNSLRHMQIEINGLNLRQRNSCTRLKRKVEVNFAD